MFLFSHTTFTEDIWWNLSSNHYSLLEDGTQNGLHLLLLSLADFMRLILTKMKMTMLIKKDSNDDWTVSTSYNAINSYNIMGRHEILAILLFLATSGTMKDFEHHKNATLQRIKIQYWGKGIYFSKEMPLPSSSSQIIMTINKYHYQNSFALWANGTEPKLGLNFTIE